MTVEDYLNKSRNINRELRNLLDERQAMLATTFGAVQLSDMKVQSSKSTTSDDLYTKLLEYDEKVAEKSHELVTHKLDLIKRKNKMPEGHLRTVLSYYYVIGLKQKEMAKILHYAERTIREQLQEARAVFADVNPDLTEE